MNDFKEDNVRLRTRLKQLLGQLRGRDRLIDELYRSAYVVTSNGNEAR
jgi:DNA-binding FrmR family transcriptional regulator